MKIDYTYADARDLINSLIEGKYEIAPNCRSKKDAFEEGFMSALSCCGVKRVSLRIFAPDGNEFPQEKIDEYNKSNNRKGEEVAA